MFGRVGNVGKLKVEGQTEEGEKVDRKGILSMLERKKTGKRFQCLMKVKIILNWKEMRRNERSVG